MNAIDSRHREQPNPQVLVLGGANVDIQGRSAARLRWGDSNPGDARCSAGGVGRNVAENLARLGIGTTLISAVGDDELGRQLLDETARVGVDVSLVMRVAGHTTPLYLSLLEPAGELALALSAMETLNALDDTAISAHAQMIAAAPLVMIDANLSPATLTAVGEALSDGACVIADPVSVAKAHRLKPILPRLTMITPNLAEAQMLIDDDSTVMSEQYAYWSRVAQQLQALGPQEVYITLGMEGLWYQGEGCRGHLSGTATIARSVTGAGDSFVAGLIYGVIHNRPIAERARLALCAALLTLQTTAAVNPDMSAERLEETSHRLSWDRHDNAHQPDTDADADTDANADTNADAGRDGADA